MGTRDPRIDAYIAKSAEFARPILTALRDTVHSACPDVEETMKWSAPYFMHHGMMCGMASFKEHCAFGFWKGSLVIGTNAPAEGAAGQFGRIAKVSDLPSKKVLTGYIKRAMALNEEGVSIKRAAPKRGHARDVAVPDDLAAALRRNRKARATFEGFSPSAKRDYVDWIVEAKRKETRQRRLETAVAQMAEGKTRHWKYQQEA